MGNRFMGKARIEELSWLAGIWESVDGESRSEEWWMAPRGGLMVGMHRTAGPARRPFFENLRIEETEGGIDYLAAPRGEGLTRFSMTASSPEKAVFENLLHDFPKRISYWIDDGGRLHALAEGESSGAPRREEWIWDRAMP